MRFLALQTPNPTNHQVAQQRCHRRSLRRLWSAVQGQAIDPSLLRADMSQPCPSTGGGRVTTPDATLLLDRLESIEAELRKVRAEQAVARLEPAVEGPARHLSRS